MTFERETGLTSYEQLVISEFAHDGVYYTLERLKRFAEGKEVSADKFRKMYEFVLEMIKVWSEIWKEFGAIPKLEPENEPVDLDEFEPLTPEQYAERLGEGP